MLRRLVGEAIGTGFLMAVVVGSAAMGSRLGADPALGLLASSLASGAALFIFITILGPVSGGHLNPVVSLSAMVDGEISRPMVIVYALAQTVGAVTGAMLAHAMFDLPLWQASAIAGNLPSLWLSEAVATFGLIFVILGAAAMKGPVPVFVGAYITAGYWFTASTSFANPAMTIARTLTGTGAGIGAADLPAYVLAQFAGGILAIVLGRWLFRSPQ